MDTCSGVETSILNCNGGGDAGIWFILTLIINILSVLIGVLAISGIVIFGIQYSASGGNADKATKAKRRLVEIILGIIVYALLWGILQWLIPGGFFNQAGSSVENIALSLSKTTIYVGESTGATVKITPDTATNKTYSISSEDTKIAIASSGTVRCVAAGTANITAMAVDGKTSTVSIMCKEKPVAVVDDKEKDKGSSSSSSSSSSQTGPRVIYEEKISPSNGGKNIATEDFAKVESYSISKQEAFNYTYEREPTFDDLLEMLEEFGIEEGTDDYILILGWAYNEGYYDADKYLGYLSAAVMINDVLEKVYNQARYNYDPYTWMKNWGNYSKAHLLDNINTMKNNPTKNESKAAIKSAYLALKYLRKGIHSCWGVPTLEEVPANAIYYKFIHNMNGAYYYFVT